MQKKTYKSKLFISNNPIKFNKFNATKDEIEYYLYFLPKLKKDFREKFNLEDDQDVIRFDVTEKMISLCKNASNKRILKISINHNVDEKSVNYLLKHKPQLIKDLKEFSWLLDLVIGMQIRGVAFSYVLQGLNENEIVSLLKEVSLYHLFNPI